MFVCVCVCVRAHGRAYIFVRACVTVEVDGLMTVNCVYVPLNLESCTVVELTVECTVE